MRSIFLITLVGAVGMVYGNVIPPTGAQEEVDHHHHAAVNQADADSTGSNQDMEFDMATLIDHDSLLKNDTMLDGTDINSAMSMLSNPSQIVQMHNSRRARHQVAPVRWSPTLANFAQRWANGCRYGHTNDPRYGENIAMGLPTWESVMKAWHDDEEILFDYQNGGFSMATGHFTQIVWRGTSTIGCAAQSCPRGIYFVCEYAQPGNVRGEYRQNVFPRKY